MGTHGWALYPIHCTSFIIRVMLLIANTRSLHTLVTCSFRDGPDCAQAYDYPHHGATKLPPQDLANLPYNYGTEDFLITTTTL